MKNPRFLLILFIILGGCTRSESVLDVDKVYQIDIITGKDNIDTIKIRDANTISNIANKLNNNKREIAKFICNTSILIHYRDSTVLVCINQNYFKVRGIPYKSGSNLETFLQELLQDNMRRNQNLPPPPKVPAKHLIKYKNGKEYEFKTDEEYQKFLDSAKIKVTDNKIQ